MRWHFTEAPQARPDETPENMVRRVPAQATFESTKEASKRKRD
jgi:hypothetical protein